MAKGPYCGYEGEFEKYVPWQFKFYDVKMFYRPKYKGAINHLPRCRPQDRKGFSGIIRSLGLGDVLSKELPFMSQLWEKFRDYLKKYSATGKRLEVKPLGAVSYLDKFLYTSTCREKHTSPGDWAEALKPNKIFITLDRIRLLGLEKRKCDLG